MTGNTQGGVRIVLRIEGLCVLLAAIFMYSKFGLGWGTFALFFLVPDLSFIAYLAGPRIGAYAYNAAHSYVGSLIVLLFGISYSMPEVIAAGLIWCAHIGFDRALGYGLKYSIGFGYTHLNLIGGAKKASVIS